MSHYLYMYRIRARILSLGGGMLSSLLSVLLVILWIATHLPERSVWLEGILAVFTGVMLLYAFDGASESLVLENKTIVFDGWLTRRRVLSLHGVANVLLVHEGLNLEWGIETLTFQHADGNQERLPLGPLWRRRDLEAFLVELEKQRHDHKMVEEIR